MLVAKGEGRTDQGEEKENAKSLAGCVWVCEGKVERGDEGGGRRRGWQRDSPGGRKKRKKIQRGGGAAALG